MYVFVCEDSIEGILTGVYDAWDSRYGHDNIRLMVAPVINIELFSEYITVAPNLEKSEKVRRTLIRQMGDLVYQDICHGIMSNVVEKREGINKAEAVYRTIVYGLSMKRGEKVLEHLSDPYIATVFRLARASYNESHHYLGFLRFKELKNNILFSEIHPTNNIIHVLATHFADRLPLENFIIYDDNRKVAAVHKESCDYVVVDASNIDRDAIRMFSDQEESYQRLWLGFFDNIAITSRINPRLQSQNIPKHFWKDTVELS